MTARKRLRVRAVDPAEHVERHQEKRARRLDRKRGQTLRRDDLQTRRGIEPPANAGLGDERVEHFVLRHPYGVGEAGVIAVRAAVSVQVLAALVRSLSQLLKVTIFILACCAASAVLVSSARTLKIQ